MLEGTACRQRDHLCRSPEVVWGGEGRTVGDMVSVAGGQGQGRVGEEGVA